MIDLEQLKRDREAGTPGPWTWETESGEWPDHVLVDANGDSVMWFDLDIGFRFASEGVKRLIARVPDLEAMVLEQVDEITRLRAEIATARECIANLEESEERLETELSAAREQVAGAYLAAIAVQDQKISYWEAETESRTGHRADMASAILAGHLSSRASLRQLTPSDATAALEAHDARVRADIVSLIDAEIDTAQSVMPIGAATFLVLNKIKQQIDTLHTDASRKAVGDA